MRSSKHPQADSNRYNVRREGDVWIVENVSSNLDDADAFVQAFRNALAKQGKGIVIHLPSPKWITSLVVDALGSAQKTAAENGVAFAVVVHPKIRLLMRMFELENDIRAIDRLQTALEEMTAS